MKNLDFNNIIFKIVKNKCISRESNPGQLIGSEICYHYTTDALIRTAGIEPATL